MAMFPLALLALIIHSASSNILNLPDGMPCNALFGDRGTCKLLNKCRDPGDFRREHPPICSFSGTEPIICCPKSTSERTMGGVKARQYCRRLVTNCGEAHNNGFTTNGIHDPREVMGGIEAKSKVHKFMALIGYGASAESKQWGCGGSLVNSRFVLSAAHCSEPQILGRAKWARLGDLDISTNTDDESIQELVIMKRIVHPGYKEPEVYHDIALFKLERDVLFTAWVAPVCLHTERNIPVDEATVTGWGRVDFAGETSSKLLEADLNVFNDSECRRLLPYKDNKTPRGIDTNLMFCAGKRDGSKDACSGDSGGPLVISKPSNCLKTQIGITSFGSQCGLPDSPGVYTRVSHYIEWIEGVVFYNETGF